MIWNDDTEKTTGISREEKFGISKIVYVDIVRCKDCKFRQSRVFRIINGKKCNYCEMVKGYKPADWFCADGKKRENFRKPVSISATDWEGINCE